MSEPSDEDLEATVIGGGTAGTDELDHKLRLGRPEFGDQLDGLRARLAATAGGLAPRVVGRHRLGRVMGSGAFGTVYEAEDPELDRRVAVKLLSVRTEREAARVIREARMLATLSHPNVVQVFEVGAIDEGRSPYVVMELVEGATLRQWLERAPRSWREIVEVGLGAARGLHAAHEAGIVHRDFKPDNLLIGEDRRPRVIDFGLARPVGDDPASEGRSTLPSGGGSPQLTATGQVMGTPAYMAPEMFLGTCTPLSDQYGLCASLFEALFGQRPFVAKSTDELRKLALTREVTLPEERRGVPRRVQAVVMRGLSSRPEERFADLAQLGAALEDASSPPRWGRRGMALAGLGAVALVGVAMVGPREETADPAAAMVEEPAAGEQAPPAETPEVAALRAETERLRELLDTAQQAEALTLSESLLGRARALEHGPSLVELLLLRGQVLVLATDFDAALVVLEEAYFLADDQGMPRQAAHAASELVGVLGYQSDRYEDAHGWQDHAEAAFERAGLDPRQHAPYMMSVAGLATREGRRDEAIAMLRESIASVEHGDRARGSEHAALLRALGRELYVEQQLDEAIALMTQAVEIYAEHDGERSVLYSGALDNLGVLVTAAERYEEALAHHLRALAIREELLEPMHMDLGRSHGNLGRVLGFLGRHEEALAHFERALEIFSERLGPGNSAVGRCYEDRGMLNAQRGPELREEALRDLDKAARIYDGAGIIYAPTAARVRETILALGGTPPPAPSIPIPP